MTRRQEMRDDYEHSWIRDRAARLHEIFSDRRTQRWGDWLFIAGGGFVLLVIMAFVGSDALPILDTGFDLLIWFAIPPIVTLALATLARSLRRRRHGSLASTQIQSTRDVLQLVVGVWLALMALVGFVADAREGGITGLGGFFGVVGASILSMSAVLVYRYVVRE